jgi:hypothetical protein
LHDWNFLSLSAWQEWWVGHAQALNVSFFNTQGVRQSWRSTREIKINRMTKFSQVAFSGAILHGWPYFPMANQYWLLLILHLQTNTLSRRW